MLLINCPWCGSRDETEFRYGGPGGVAYPWNANGLTDQEWADLLLMRENPKGPLSERWVHIAGCRRWFVVRRNTVTNEILP